MRTSPSSITSLPPSPRDEQRARVVKYTVAMAIRLVCFLVILVFAVVAPGWWLLIPALGAIFLPYFAVVIANAPMTRAAGRVVAPGQREIGSFPSDETR